MVFIFMFVKTPIYVFFIYSKSKTSEKITALLPFNLINNYIEFTYLKKLLPE